MNLGPHESFIIASYAVTTLVVVALIGWIAADYAAQRRVLNDLEQRGITRRSQRAKDNVGDAP